MWVVVAGAGWLIFAGALVYPAAALLVRAVDAPWPEGFDISWVVFRESVALAGAGALAGVLLSLPGAYALGRQSSQTWGAVTVSVLLMPLLLPPMVYAFGWDRMAHIPDTLQCVLVWASWSWPVPALLIGSGWRRLGRRAFEEALTNTGAWSAFYRAVLPILRRQIATSLLVLFAFFLGDYSVPHACGLIVYSTDLLSRCEAGSSSLAVLLASLPVAGLILLALLGAAAVWGGDTGDEEVVEGGACCQPTSRLLWPSILVALAVGCAVVPVCALAQSVNVVDALSMTVRTYGYELGASIGVVLVAGLAAVVMGGAVVVSRRFRRMALVWGLCWAALPGALVGQAIVAAYLPFPRVYDHWVMMVLGYVARFGWVGILAAWLSQACAGRSQVWAAQVDGASRAGANWRIGLASNWVMLACGVLIVAGVSLSEVATTALVRVPSVSPISLILIEKFHRFEDGVLVGLSVLMVLAALPGVLLAGWAARRWA